MSVRLFLLIPLAALLAFSGVSCRREQKPEQPGAPKPGARPAAAAAVSERDAKAAAAVQRLHDAERQWVAESPEAAAALQKLKETQAQYQGTIEKFGLYMQPYRERQAKMNEWTAAQAKGDPALEAKAKEAFRLSSEQVEAGEARVRLGNPQVQALYDEWVAAQKAYEEARRANPVISKASEEVSRLMSAPKTSVESGKDGVKE